MKKLDIKRLDVTLSRQQGFTLIELMVVIVIMGVMLGLMSLSLGVLDSRKKQQVQYDILVTLNQLAKKARMQQTPIAVVYQSPTIQKEGALKILSWKSNQQNFNDLLKTGIVSTTIEVSTGSWQDGQQRLKLPSNIQLKFEPQSADSFVGSPHQIQLVFGADGSTYPYKITVIRADSNELIGQPIWLDRAGIARSESERVALSKPKVIG